MIFVTLGTLQYPFDRLAQVINGISYKQSSRIIVQTGHTGTFLSRKGVSLFPFLSTSEIKSYIQQSDLVLTHGGEGTLLDLLEYSKYKPIIFPRSTKYQEHVDDFQSEIAAYAQQKQWAWTGDTISVIKQLIVRHFHEHPKLVVNRQKLHQNDHLINYLIKETSIYK